MKRNSRKAYLVGVLSVVVILFSWSAVLAAEVSQGKCTSFDKDKQVITIEEYNLTFTKQNPYGEPAGVVSSYDVSNAMIGIIPEPGDVLRIAFDVNGTDRVAIKVMNVSKQDLRKK